MAVDVSQVRWDHRGLAPVVVQDVSTRAVLMLAYMNEDSLALTVDSGQLHLWSRSRSEIWRKGATSGNTMTVRSIDLDCDSDTLLVTTVPAGPACHMGTVSCFGNGGDTTGIAKLWTTISARALNPQEGSYTVGLIAAGTDATARKVIEEAGEVVIAAKNHQVDGEAEQVISESADLIYHLLVLLAERGLDLAAVEQELDARASS